MQRWSGIWLERARSALMQLNYLISADYARTTGGWIYNERLLRELARLGWRIERIELPPGFPDPPAEARAAGATLLARLPAGARVLADQICLSPLADAAEREAHRLRLAIILHHPQVLEASRPPEIAARMDREERQALAACSLVIATSRRTARQLVADYGVPAERLLIAEPGTDKFPPSPGSSGGPVRLLSIGSLIPRKRYGMIIEALAGLGTAEWQLIIAGSAELAPAYAADLQRNVAARGLAGRVTLAGEKTGAELDALWQGADIYVAASAHEGFGMAVAEAVARQIPVVSTYSGAVGDWLQREAGVIAESHDAAGLRDALRRVIADASLRARLRAGAKSARSALAPWPQTAARVDTALRL